MTRVWNHEENARPGEQPLILACLHSKSIDVDMEDAERQRMNPSTKRKSSRKIKTRAEDWSGQTLPREDFAAGSCPNRGAHCPIRITPQPQTYYWAEA